MEFPKWPNGWVSHPGQTSGLMEFPKNSINDSKMEFPQRSIIKQSIFLK